MLSLRSTSCRTAGGDEKARDASFLSMTSRFGCLVLPDSGAGTLSVKAHPGEARYGASEWPQARGPDTVAADGLSCGTEVAP